MVCPQNNNIAWGEPDKWVGGFLHLLKLWSEMRNGEVKSQWELQVKLDKEKFCFDESDLRMLL